MGIINDYRKMYKKTQLPIVDKKITDEEIKNEMKLIAEKKSKKSARERKAIMLEAEKRGINNVK